jgi:putative ABC transport system permease protein
MSMSILRRITNLFHRSKLDQEIEAELRSHIEMRTADNIAVGMSPEEARRQAVLRFGGRAAMKERVIAADAQMFLDSLWQDLCCGVRTLRKSPGFAAFAILTLVLGIGANAYFFQLIDAVDLRTLPVRDPASLAIVHFNMNDWMSGDFTGSYSESTFPLWQQVEERQQAFSSIAAWGGTQLNLANGGEVDYAQAIWVSGEFFDVLGIRPFLGRLISPSDDPEDAQAGCAGAVDLSYSFWQRRYGGDRSVIGKTLTLGGRPFPVVGVTPPSFFGVSVGNRFDVAVPVCAEPIIDGQNSLITSPSARQDWWLAILGRLRPGWTLARATAQLETIAPAALHATVPLQYSSDDVKHYLAYTLEARSAANGFSSMREGSSDWFCLLLGLSGLVLLIACANIASLLLARATAREREIAVRLALGAWCGRLIRQLLAESALLAIAGAVCGVWLASALSRAAIASMNRPGSAIFLDMPTDWRVLGFAAALAILTTLLFGLAPALRASGAAPGAALKASGPGMTVGRKRFRLQRILVASQVALSVVLVALALLFARNLLNVMTRNPGFQEKGVLVANLDRTRLNLSVAQGSVFERNLLDRIRALPGVAAAGTSTHSPASRGTFHDLVLDDKGKYPNGASDLDYISPDYFRTMEIPILAGRDFNYGDTATSPKVAIVNQAFVKAFLKGTKDPIGKEFRIGELLGEPEPYYTVVGLVRDSVYNNMRAPMPPIMYFARAQAGGAGLSGLLAAPVLLIRSRGSRTGLVHSVKDVIAGVNPEINIIQFEGLRTQIRESLSADKQIATLCGFFGGLALLVAAIGLYGVISYTVAQRTNEIGIRMALGAQRAGVVRQILGEAAILVGIGLVVGLGLALAGGTAAGSIFFGLKPWDPLTLALTLVILGATSFFASFLPARRAMRVDPMVALRYEE